MAEIALFHELHGDYVANSGQTINLREYLDYFEPLGSALSRLPDGTGGPFVHHFTDSGGHTIGSIGWVVSAASKRFGAWTLWGMWSDRAIPPVALPLFWSALADPARTSDLVSRANADAERILERKRWPDLLEEVKTFRLRDDALRQSLKGELERAWAVPPPYRQAIEVELTPKMLDVLPWLYILGPVDPLAAQLQPSRFNGAGYQYILNERHAPARAGAALRFDMDELLDATASDVVAGWRMAQELRTQRERPKRTERPLLRTKPVETNAMRSENSSTREKTTQRPAIWNSTETIFQAVYRIAVLALLVWIAFNVNIIRKATIAQRNAPPAVSQPAPLETTEPPPAPAPEEALSRARIARIAAALSTKPPRNIRISAAVLGEIAQGGADSADKLARVAIEIFLRRNACFPRTEVADGKFSAAEQRAIRSCAVLQDERLMKSAIEPDTARAIDWLERLVPPGS
jgi:hypothetical protein